MAWMQDILASLFSFGDALTVLLWVILAGIGVLVVGFFMKFKHQLIVLERVNNRKLIFRYRARELVDKDNVVWWQINKRMKKIKAPPSDAIEIDAKGRKFAIAERTEQDSYVFTSLNTDGEKTELKTLDSDDRMAYAHQLRLSQKYKQSTFKDVVLQFGPVFVLGMVIIMGMIMADDIAQPFFKNKELQIQYAQIETEQLELLRDIKQHVQTIRPEAPQNGS